MISLDISKAFDSIWHKVLLAKLPMFGVHHTLIKWIGSFFSDRSIAVRVDGFFSNQCWCAPGLCHLPCTLHPLHKVNFPPVLTNGDVLDTSIIFLVSYVEERPW